LFSNYYHKKIVSQFDKKTYITLFIVHQYYILSFNAVALFFYLSFPFFLKKFLPLLHKILQDMAKKKEIKQIEVIEGEENPKEKQYKEADLILLFNLKRIVEYQTPLMEEWLAVENPILNVAEQYIFDKKYKEAVNNISGWSEEDLKVKFIAAIIELGHLESGNGIVTFFDKQISATVEGTHLTVKSDFMMAKGLLDVFTTPYFHFQEYKPYKKPSGDSMAQLLEAFMIAQVKNKDKQTPLYGIEIIGERWRFVIMVDKEYCTSPTYDCLKKNDLLQIIAILRKFMWILETRLMK
jgi:hypothetical protein